MTYVMIGFFIALVIVVISAMIIAVKKNKNSLSTKEMVELEKMITKQMIIPENSNSKNDIKSRYDVFIDGKEIGNNFEKDDLLVILNSLVNDQEYEHFDEIIFKKHD